MDAPDAAPELIDVPVAGGRLRVARWGTGPNVAIGAHGITGSSMGWRAVGRHLDDDWTLLAPDLRGRGGSRHLPGPYGLEAHADDLSAVAGHVGADEFVLAGHSMGAYVAVVTAARAPAGVRRVVLIDGGLPLPRADESVGADQVLEATIGPALDRLGMTFSGPEDYIDFWRRHPAFSRWNDDLEAYVLYDLTGEPGSMRSKVVEAAVRSDGRDLFLGQDAIAAALRAIKVPVSLIRAPRGLFDEPGGFHPESLVEAWRPDVAHLTDEVVLDTNHYTIQLGDAGAAVIAARIAGR
jgi:pimeloyl-ACP methyl ester carboxylesterase